MFTFVFIMTIGAIIGYTLRHKNSTEKIPFLIQIVVCTLLFLLGISVGDNKLIIDNLSYYCEQAAVISFLSILGSAIAAFILYHFCFKEKNNER